MARARRTPPAGTPAVTPQAESYSHPGATSPRRPDVGTQAQFKKKKPAQTYRYDSSLSPQLEYDDNNPARELGESLIRQILEAGTLEEAKAAASKLKALGAPFLNWAGKAERFSFELPTLPLFTHERLSTGAIIESLRGHKRQMSIYDLFADPEHSVADQLLKSYEHSDKWTNRMILGDSLAVMNSLLHFEHLGGQVQMIYMDPPYGVKYGSNFQPFVRKRDVGHNDDDDMSREPEMVQAYRDTWEIGLHSYLTYLRDRLLLSREMLHPSGSIFVQISDENLHHVRELMDEVFGAENFVCVITFRTTAALYGTTLATNSDYILWYARNKETLKVRKLYKQRTIEDDIGGRYTRIQLADGSRRPMTTEERESPNLIPKGSRIYRHDNLTSQGATATSSIPFEFEGTTFHPGSNRHWKTTLEGIHELVKAKRVAAPTPNSLTYVRFMDDFPVAEINNVWTDTQTGAFTDEKVYVVQSNTKVIARCLLLSTDPGDLVLDPTCGSGTTAYVAEQWGRRWITTDVSRVPLALARQRLLTATFDWYDLKDAERGPAAGFIYKRKQNRKGEEVGGIVPHVTAKEIANHEQPKEEVLVDRPEVKRGITRVSGPFTVEATIPTAMDLNEGGTVAHASGSDGFAPERMIEILRSSPVLRLDGNRTITLKNIRPPAKSLSLSAEALQTNGEDKPVAFVFGPENGPISEKLVYEAAREANAKNYHHLYAIGFAIEAKARQLVDQCAEAFGMAATYVQATPDLLMGDLLKNMRSSQIFSVCGLPEIEVEKVKKKGEPDRFQVTLLGLDVFNPITMVSESRKGNDVPAWFLDTDYNGLCFHVCQAFFPRTSAWDNLKKSLKAEYKPELWDHLSGTTSAPFEAGNRREIAVKVIDDRGNELLVVKPLK